MLDLTPLLMGDPPPGRRELIARCGNASGETPAPLKIRRPGRRSTDPEFATLCAIPVGGSLVVASLQRANYLQQRLHAARRGRFRCRTRREGGCEIMRV